MDDSFALQVCQLTVNYDKTPVLWDVTVDIPKGVSVGIIGPNGAGKTTFLKAALSLLKPLSGKVRFFGESLSKVRKRVAYVPQRATVDWDFPIRVKDLVLMGRYGKLGPLRWPRRADVVAAHQYLEMVGMEQYATRQIKQLSGGQQQRVFIARALMQQADFYFMDEPFAGIDMASEKTLVELFHELQKQGKTICAVHHDLNTVDSYFDWTLVLNMRLIAAGPTKEVFNATNLNAAYGKSYALFDETLRRSLSQTTGIK